MGRGGTSILQVEARGVYLPSPPVPGQVLTVDQIRSQTGEDPGQYDLLVEVDLDAALTVSSTFNAIGYGGTGCFEKGSPYINIYFPVSKKEYLEGFPKTVFDHEFTHSMGWAHWWPNADGSVAMQMTTDFYNNYTFPAMMFGWIDLDGDGIVEILDPTPYGLIP